MAVITKYFLVLGVLSSLVGCASHTVQVDRLLESQGQYQSQVEIPDVPFIEQSAGHCGPATLAMALAWAGKPVSVETLVPQVYTPGMKGSLQTDMVSAARRQGMLAIPIKGFSNLMSELAAGNPVIVFENLSVSWLPQWHYAVVFGYDLKSQTVLMHSGPEANKRWDLRKFERSWELGEYWGLVVLPPGKLAASASELEQVRAAASLEQLGYLTEALTAYESILKRWPESLPALIGKGNVTYAEKKYQVSLAALERATRLHPNSISAWNNLSVVQLALGLTKQSETSARAAQSLR